MEYNHAQPLYTTAKIGFVLEIREIYFLILMILHTNTRQQVCKETLSWTLKTGQFYIQANSGRLLTIGTIYLQNKRNA